MKTKAFGLVLLGVAAGGWWAFERNANARLQLQLAALQERAGVLAKLQEEQIRLRTLQTSPEEVMRLQREIADRAALAEAAARAEVERANRPWPVGDWAGPESWSNRGQATPERALETTLWAASGGELKTLKGILTFEEKSLATAGEILRRQSGAAWTDYQPDDLLTLLAARDVPLEPIQLYARTRHDDDTITDSTFFKMADGRIQLSHLTFHREDGIWKLRVPDIAVKAMANELAGIPEPTPVPRNVVERPPPQGSEPKS
jgi:hypothetical protein